MLNTRAGKTTRIPGHHRLEAVSRLMPVLGKLHRIAEMLPKDVNSMNCWPDKVFCSMFHLIATVLEVCRLRL